MGRGVTFAASLSGSGLATASFLSALRGGGRHPVRARAVAGGAAAVAIISGPPRQVAGAGARVDSGSYGDRRRPPARAEAVAYTRGPFHPAGSAHLAASDSPAANAPGQKRRAWPIALALLLLLALIAAAAWWWKTQQDDAAGRAARLAAALERQKALREELAALKPADPASCPPGEVLQPISTGPGAPGAPAASGPAASAAPTLAAAPITGGSAKPMADGALARHLEQATAMVIVVNGDKLSTGTGFFIAPNLLVTNRHVVEAAQQQVLLTSDALQSLRRATVVRKTDNSNVGSPDFALLRLDEGTAPGTLDAAEEVSKLAPVVAAGFPGVVVENDVRFRRLLAGDAGAAPDLNLTQGAVQSLQTGAGGMPLIVHTASIAKGNSGGPLVDACGRLVGINTFINVDQSQSAKINYAIRSSAMQSFLQSAGSGARLDGRPCTRG